MTEAKQEIAAMRVALAEVSEKLSKASLVLNSSRERLHRIEDEIRN